MHGRRRIEAPRGPFETSAFEKRAANELLQQRLEEVKSHAYTRGRQRLTFAELAKQWIDSKVKIGQSKIDDYNTMLECYLLPYFGPRKIEAISRLNIERFRAEMAKGVPDSIERARAAKLEALKAENPHARLKPLDPGPRTTNKCLGVLVSIFGYVCDDHRLLAHNPATRIEKLPVEQDDESIVIEENVLNPDELCSALAHAIDPYRIPIALAMFCGLRNGEVVGLKWGDIDWNRATAEIRRQQRRGRFWTPKTAASRRTIELPAQLLSMLKAWRVRVQHAETNPHDLVCPSVRGKPMQASALLQRGLHGALRRAGIRQVRFHDLRHSFASNLLGPASTSSPCRRHWVTRTCRSRSRRTRTQCRRHDTVRATAWRR